jgi:hypothetical protein
MFKELLIFISVMVPASIFTSTTAIATSAAQSNEAGNQTISTEEINIPVTNLTTPTESNLTASANSYLSGLLNALSEFNEGMFDGCLEATNNQNWSELRRKDACGGPNGSYAIAMIGSPGNPGEVSVYITNLGANTNANISGTDPFSLFTSVWNAGSNQNMTTQTRYDGPLIEVVNVPEQITRSGFETLEVNGLDSIVVLNDFIPLLADLEKARVQLTEAYNTGNIPFQIDADLENPLIIWHQGNQSSQG